jgi:hypothetical protein
MRSRGGCAWVRPRPRLLLTFRRGTAGAQRLDEWRAAVARALCRCVRAAPAGERVRGMVRLASREACDEGAVARQAATRYACAPGASQARACAATHATPTFRGSLVAGCWRTATVSTTLRWRCTAFHQRRAPTRAPAPAMSQTSPLRARATARKAPARPSVTLWHGCRRQGLS